MAALQLLTEGYRSLQSYIHPRAICKRPKFPSWASGEGLILEVSTYFLVDTY
jgi:hypothetical protein